MGWTTLPSGKAVDWSKPPYRQGCIVRLVLEGEDPTKLSSATIIERTEEFYALLQGRGRQLYNERRHALSLPTSQP